MATTRSQQTAKTPPPPAGSTRLLLGLIMLLATGLRLPHLGGRGYFLDEISSVAIAGADLATFWHIVANFEANMSLYYAALRLWLPLGDGEATVRFLSVIPAVATIPVVYAIGARWFGLRAGLVAALLLALNGLHLSWSQTARGYTLAVFLVTLAFHFFQRGIEEPRARHWTAYAITGVLATYAHFFAGVVLLSQWISLALLRRRAVPWREVGASIGVIILGVMPLLVFAVAQDVGQIDWQEEPSPQRVLGAVNFIAGGDGSKAPLILYIAAVAAAGLTAPRLRRSAGGSPQAWRLGLLALWLCLPIAFAVVVSLVKPVFSVRYLTVCIPPLALLAAIGISRARSRALLAAALVAFGLAAFPSVVAPPDLRRSEWAAATAYVLDHARPRDGLFFYVAKGRLAFEHYSRRRASQTRAPIVVFPERWTWDYLVVERVQTPPPEVLQGLNARYERMWLVLAHDWVRSTGRDVMSRSIQVDLARQFPREEARQFRGLRIILYQKNPGAAQER